MADHTADPRASRPDSFVSACLAGTARPADVDDWVDAWHDSDSERTLAEFLGFTAGEYSRWARDPRALDSILTSARATSARRPCELLRPDSAHTVAGSPAPACGCPDGECHEAGKTGCYFGAAPAEDTAKNPEGPLR